MRLITFTLVLATVTGCQSSEPDLSLAPDLGEAEERLRRRMHVRVLQDFGQGAPTELDPMEASEFALGVHADCQDQLALAGVEVSACNDPSSPCARLHCRAQSALCVSHTLLDIAGTVTPVRLRRPGYLVPPQSSATNAALSTEAIKYARQALLLADRALREEAFDAGGGTCDTLVVRTTA